MFDTPKYGIELLQKGKISITFLDGVTSKGRTYQTNFKVEGFDESLLQEKTNKFIYDFMAKDEPKFKKSSTETIKSLRPNFLELTKSIKRAESKASQGSDEWLLERLMYLTSTSSFEKKTWLRIAGARIAKKLELLEQSWSSQLSESILETMIEPDRYVSPAMERGTQYEDVAIGILERKFKTEVKRRGLIKLKSKQFNILATSIDGEAMINEKHIVFEIKSPSYPKFLDSENYKMYIQQCMIHKIVTNCDEVWVVEYYPHHELKITKLELEEDRINDLIEKGLEIQKKVDKMVEEKFEEIVGF